ncbi:MAG: helix-turn-helix domain-containing protein [Candidatus Latescibacterota bacterium]
MSHAVASEATAAPAVCDVLEAARFLGVGHRTLDNWRSQGRGPRYARVGRRVVYLVADLERFLQSRVVDPAKR